jgi:excisionase family DNA binding protein
MDQERKTITVEEAAKLLGISRSSAYAAAARGELPVIRIGRLLLVSKARMQRLLDGIAASRPSRRP